MNPNVPKLRGVDQNINMKGLNIPSIDIKGRKISLDDNNIPVTLRDIFDGDVDEDISINKIALDIPTFSGENLAYITGQISSSSRGINIPSASINLKNSIKSSKNPSLNKYKFQWTKY